MTFIRKIKKKSGTYLAEVENKWENGTCKQHYIKYIGKETEGKPTRRITTTNITATTIKRHLDVEIINHLTEELNLKHYLTPQTLVLLYSQLLERPSINKMEQWLNETDILEILKIENITTHQLYTALEQLQEQDFTEIEKTIANTFAKYETKQSLIIDITDTYFEGADFDEKPRRGKDGKVKKLVQVAMAVSKKWGFPIFHRTFDGNISGKNIYKEMLATLAPLGYTGVIVDRGMYTAQNIKDTVALGLSSICGVVRHESFDEVIRGIDKSKLYCKENRVVLKNTDVYVVSVGYLGGELLVVYDPLVEVAGRKRLYDEGGGDVDCEFLGFSLIFHNTGLDCFEVVRVYFEKDVVERSFRCLKGVLGLRPVRVWLRSHVEAHMKICYVAYAVLSLLAFRISCLGISVVDALDLLRLGYRVELCDVKSGFVWDLVVELKSEQKKIRDLVYKKG